MNQAAPIKVSVALVGVLAVLGLAAGCGSEMVGNPAAQPSSTSSSVSHGAGQVPNSGAPKVQKPLHASTFRERPCEVLSRQQLDKLELHAKGELDADGSLGRGCDWNDTGGRTGGSYGITFVKGGAGLSGPYSHRTSSFFKEIDPIAGYPAVISMTGDHRAEGSCTIAVGINDHQEIAISADMDRKAPNYDNPCGVAAKLAEKVVETVKGRQ